MPKHSCSFMFSPRFEAKQNLIFQAGFAADSLGQLRTHCNGSLRACSVARFQSALVLNLSLRLQNARYLNFKNAGTSGGCKWPQVATGDGRKWPQVAARGRKWPLASRGSLLQVHGSHLPLEWLQVAAGGCWAASGCQWRNWRKWGGCKWRAEVVASSRK